jgi:hypothetical protein
VNTPSPTLTALPSVTDDILQWVPLAAAIIALATYLTSVISTMVQQGRSRRVDANSVLISLVDDKFVHIYNAGPSPILDIQAQVDGVHLDSGLPDSLRPNDSLKFESATSLVPSFPDSVVVSFIDARGKRWQRKANESATRPKRKLSAS